MLDAHRTVNLGQLLHQAFRWFDEGLVARLRSAGWAELTRAHSSIFAVIDIDGTRISELARRSGVTRQAAHQVVQDLVRQGLVELQPDPTNRSARRAVPTASGRHSIEMALTVFDDLETELVRRIGADNVSRLRDALEHDWGPPPVG
jgi:DNA-binding MarR family transcriptional regulator